MTKKQILKVVQEAVECLKNNNVNSYRPSKQLVNLIRYYFESVEKLGVFASLENYLMECSGVYGETLYVEYLIMQEFGRDYERNKK